MELNEAAILCHLAALSNGWWHQMDCQQCYATGTVIGMSMGDRTEYTTCPRCHGLKVVAILDRNVGEMIALMHSELSETLDALREPGVTVGDMWWKGDKPEGPAVELVDCIIRVFDTLAAYGVDVEGIMKLKLEYNKSRGQRHGGRAM